MDCENIILNVRNTLYKENKKLKKKDKKDDYQQIKRCKELFNEEIEKNIDLNEGITKQYILSNVKDYFNFEKSYLNNEIKFKLMINNSILLIILVIIFQTCLQFINLFFQNQFQTSILFIINYLLIFIFLIFIMFFPNKTKEFKLNYKIKFILGQALKELKEDLEMELREEILKPNSNVELTKEELDELLNESNQSNEIITHIYDRKISMERRKRRKK